jgi:hypothetical protein
MASTRLKPVGWRGGRRRGMEDGGGIENLKLEIGDLKIEILSFRDSGIITHH